ncbi:hypothetical protein IWQ60_004129 [Tieghemiomyces parasiticus]|uniref:Glycosyl transferase family 25 domain-containing protein n=1 Tax=Tieghemiomyces parasiticus TaxID=78921 RepID=A0A9W8A8Z6_9FUNG|nr:hypothetical protein IWQ60_004129 [Tieghemiomyces parasiticus]
MSYERGLLASHNTKLPRTSRHVTYPRLVALAALALLLIWTWSSNSVLRSPIESVRSAPETQQKKESFVVRPHGEAASEPAPAPAAVPQAPVGAPAPTLVASAPRLSTTSISRPAPAVPVQAPVPEPIPAHDNKLGFGDIYVINLKHRTDRRARMLLQADFLDLEFNFFEASTPDTVGFVPPNPSRQKGMTPHRLACWRSHMNVYMDIVARNLSHALIVEDDVNFDLSIPSVVPRALAKINSLGDWDVFYVGHCSLTERTKPVVDAGLNLYPTNAPYCAHAYAVSRRGARRLLHHMRSAPAAVDLLQVGLHNAKLLHSYSLDPPLVVQPRDPDDPSDIPDSTAVPKNQVLKDSTYDAMVDYIHQGGSRDRYFKTLDKPKAEP